MKIAIVGSRGFKDYNLLEEFVLGKVNLTDIEEIISGGAIGADTLAQEFAQKHNLKLNVFLPNWTKYGKSAGVVRNKDIIQNSDIVFAFWDEKSKGTYNIIRLSKKLNKTLHIKYDYTEHHDVDSKSRPFETEIPVKYECINEHRSLGDAKSGETQQTGMSINECFRLVRDGIFNLDRELKNAVGIL